VRKPRIIRRVRPDLAPNVSENPDYPTCSAPLLCLPGSLPSKAVAERARRAQREWRIARVSEIPPGGRKMVEVEGRSIGVFNVHGTFVAVRGTALASLPGEYCWGRAGEILACPWHSWEFDLLTRRALADTRKRLHLYLVVVQEDMVHVILPR
jgi:nitrite reductase/ring-hydroxylating ferredoxin subunit